MQNTYQEKILDLEATNNSPRLKSDIQNGSQEVEILNQMTTSPKNTDYGQKDQKQHIILSGEIIPQGKQKINTTKGNAPMKAIHFRQRNQLSN